MKILVIRRDNIGDLVCTTPLFLHYGSTFQRQKLTPWSIVTMLLCWPGNPEIDQIHVYRKAKHREPGESRFKIWCETARPILRLRKENFDLAIIATPARQPGALRFAQCAGAKRIIAYGNPEWIVCTRPHKNDGGHETELVMRLLHPLGIKDNVYPLRVFAEPRPVEAIFCTSVINTENTADRPSHLRTQAPQRWPEERFSELAHTLHARYGARFLLFWVPWCRQPSSASRR